MDIGPKPEPKIPTRTPVRHRVLRCERCRTYLFDVDLARCDPGSNATVVITLKCRNKKCRKANQVTVDLINEDPK
jgi:hypothetical protein